MIMKSEMEIIDIMQIICDAMDESSDLYKDWYGKALKDLARLMWKEEQDYWA